MPVSSGFTDDGFTSNGFVTPLSGLNFSFNFKYNSSQKGTSFANVLIEESETIVNVKLR